MNDQIERVQGTEEGGAAHDIATAPGDVAMPEVEARFSSLKTQFRHDNTIEPLAPIPGESVTVWATTGVDVPVQRVALFLTTDGSQPAAGSQVLEMAVADIDWDSRAGYIGRWRAVLPSQPEGTLVRYRIGGWHNLHASLDTEPDVWAHDGQGFWFRFDADRGITTFAYDVETRPEPMPAWMHDAVIYHIFLDRFHPGNEDGRFQTSAAPRARHHGTLRGVQKALPYLESLGVTCLWLSPIHPSETYHRYDGMDFFGVDPDLGTKEDLRALIDEAHRHGMRIWLDFVPAHSSWHHPAFLAAQHDRDAKTFSWYTFNEWPNSYQSFLQVARTLPSFNTDDPGARAYLIESAVYWLRDLGVDGFRLDHAIAPSMDFWVAFKRATQGVKADVVNVGEATDTPDSLRRYRGKLHAVLDFELARTLRLAFGTGGWSASKLDAWMESYERYMADGPGRVSFLDNHDMDRFLWVAENDVTRLKLAALCQFTLSSTPVVYYGTEIGMTQTQGAAAFFGADENARGDMLWDQSLWNHDLLDYYRGLIRMRRENPVLGRGGRRAVHVDDTAGIYAYVRTQSEGNISTGDVLVVFNFADEARVIGLSDEVRESGLELLIGTGAEAAVSDGGLSLGARTAAAFTVG